MSARRVILVAALVALAVVLVTWQLAAHMLPGLLPPAPAARGTPAAHAHVFDALRELDSATWLDGRAPADKHWRAGRFVLCAFSDSDPRALAMLPVLQAWHAAYAAHGVTIIALHSPEYAFAADSGVTGRLARRLGLTLPVALDPDGSIARALGGMADGPRVIAGDAAASRITSDSGSLAGAAGLLAAVRAAMDLPALPVLHLALPKVLRTIRLGAGAVSAGPFHGVPVGHEQIYSAEFRYQEQGQGDVPYPLGGWRMGADGVTATRGGAAEVLSIKYSAGRAGVVLSPPADGPVRVWLLHDERWPVARDRDEDIQTDSRGAAFVDVREPRLYWIDRGSGERVLKLSPDRAGLTVHAFVATSARRE